MKSFSKRVASFAMAAAMVLSLAAVSPVDAQAAKKASITKKSSIKAGKTYTYKIKNVTSKQYVKVTGITSGVTVKYNNKTVKKNSTKIYGKKSGAALALKVTAKDKVANYKATIKAQVYNKSNNKKVGSLLKTTSTVKCTKLEVKDVKRASTSGKYLVATFNKPLSKLSIADVTITEKNTGILKGVEKVELSSDGKSATIALVGSEDSNTTSYGNVFVEPNTDYVFSVTQSGVTASTTFNVDAVWENLVVTATDAGKKTIDVEDGWGNDDTFTVPDSLGLDYQDILGRKITVWYNEDNSITKMNVANDKVFLDAFEYNVDRQGRAYLKAKTSGAVYYFQASTQSGNIQATKYIYYGATSGMTVNNVLDYAKVVLNSNGTIKTVAYVNKWSDSILIDEVKDNTVIAGKKFGVNLTDYVLVKDGKQIKISDIQAGDVLYYYNGSMGFGKFAEVYNNSKSGTVVETVTSDKITVDGTKYAYEIATPSFTTRYVKADDGIKDTDEDYMNALKKGAKAVKLYFDRQGRLNFIAGEPAEVKTSTKDFVLTDNVKTLTIGLDKYIRLTGGNGESGIADINFANVNTLAFDGFDNTQLVKGTAVISTNKTIYKLANFPENSADANANTVYVKDWEVDGNWTNDGSANIKLKNVYSAHDVSSTDGSNILNSTYELDNTLFNDAVKNKVVTLTYNDKDQVTGIEFCAPLTTQYSLVPGEKMLAGNQLSGTVPVYEIYSDNGTAKVKKVNYVDYKKNTATNNADVYVDNKGNVTKIVIDNTSGTAFDVTDTTTAVGVVTDVNRSYGKIIDFTIVSGKESMTFTSLMDTPKASQIQLASVVSVEYDKETKTVKTINDTTAGLRTGTVSTNTIVNKEITVVNPMTFTATKYELATTTPVTIVKIDAVTNKVTVLDYTDLSAMKDSGFASVQVLVGNYVDVILVKSDQF